MTIEYCGPVGTSGITDCHRVPANIVADGRMAGGTLRQSWGDAGEKR
jgi:hypothetical protein